MTVWSKSTRHLLAGLALTAAAVLGGCLAESEHPIAAADPDKNDPRLWGSWISEEEDGYIIAHVFATESRHAADFDRRTRVEGMGEVDSYDAHATQLPTGDYLNVMGHRIRRRLCVRQIPVRPATDAVSVWSMENEKVVQAVKDGKLPGTTKQEGSDVDVRITASQSSGRRSLPRRRRTSSANLQLQAHRPGLCGTTVTNSER